MPPTTDDRGTTVGRFDSPQENEPVDPAVESAGLAERAALVTGRTVPPGDVRELLADPDGADPEDEFVEDTVERLLGVLGVPLPVELRGAEQT